MQKSSRRLLSWPGVWRFWLLTSLSGTASGLVSSSIPDTIWTQRVGPDGCHTRNLAATRASLAERPLIPCCGFAHPSVDRKVVSSLAAAWMFTRAVRCAKTKSAALCPSQEPLTGQLKLSSHRQRGLATTMGSSRTAKPLMASVAAQARSAILPSEPFRRGTTRDGGRRGAGRVIMTSSSAPDSVVDDHITDTAMDAMEVYEVEQDGTRKRRVVWEQSRSSFLTVKRASAASATRTLSRPLTAWWKRPAETMGGAFSHDRASKWYRRINKIMTRFASQVPRCVNERGGGPRERVQMPGHHTSCKEGRRLLQRILPQPPLPPGRSMCEGRCQPRTYRAMARVCQACPFIRVVFPFRSLFRFLICCHFHLSFLVLICFPFRFRFLCFSFSPSATRRRP